METKKLVKLSNGWAEEGDQVTRIDGSSGFITYFDEVEPRVDVDLEGKGVVSVYPEHLSLQLDPHDGYKSPIIEKLRELSDKFKEEGEWTQGSAIDETCYQLGIKQNPWLAVDYSQILAFIADQIEKDYILRPKDKDGHPWFCDDRCFVDFGSWKLPGIVNGFSDDGKVSVLADDFRSILFSSEGLDRPDNTVFGEDEKAIKLGDVMYAEEEK